RSRHYSFSSPARRLRRRPPRLSRERRSLSSTSIRQESRRAARETQAVAVAAVSARINEDFATNQSAKSPATFASGGSSGGSGQRRQQRLHRDVPAPHPPAPQKREESQEPETKAWKRTQRRRMRSTDEENDTSATERAPALTVAWKATPRSLAWASKLTHGVYQSRGDFGRGGGLPDGGQTPRSRRLSASLCDSKNQKRDLPTSSRRPSWISASSALLKPCAECLPASPTTPMRCYATVDGTTINRRRRRHPGDWRAGQGGRHHRRCGHLRAQECSGEFILPVEVTRRLLNRKLCIGGRWHKYMIIRIVGQHSKGGAQLQVAQNYLHTAAVCRMYLREDVPDNAELCTLATNAPGQLAQVRALKLESPYRQTATRTVGNSPWKFGLFKPEYQGVNAVERITALHDQFQMGRQSALALETGPHYTRVLETAKSLGLDLQLPCCPHRRYGRAPGRLGLPQALRRTSPIWIRRQIDVMMNTASLQLTVRPWPSVRRPSSNNWSSVLRHGPDGPCPPRIAGLWPGRGSAAVPGDSGCRRSRGNVARSERRSNLAASCLGLLDIQGGRNRTNYCRFAALWRGDCRCTDSTLLLLAPAWLSRV
uniref:Ribosomal_L16 domain-containing protein n=1 Tax=Macrostomum lignano TaxID=282301 RepID=A0A1I8FDM2_9PLAT